MADIPTGGVRLTLSKQKRSPWQGRRRPSRFAVLVALALVATLLIPQGVSADTPSPGPCDDGYVAPTPVEVPVTSVPITVASTTDDYFVLYAEVTNIEQNVEGALFSKTSTLPVSVTRGEDGTTTLADNLASLPASRYKVEKYSVALPGNVDGDCFDDLTELADLGTYNPVNPARKVSREFGAAAIDSLSTFQELSVRGDWKGGKLGHLGNLEWVNYVISKAETDNPILNFINSSLGRSHGAFHWATGVPVESVYSRGSIVYHPSIQAPDGSLGIYRFSFDGLERGVFEDVQKYGEVLAASMPVLNNNLYYYPTTGEQVRNYNREKSMFDASRIHVLTEADILGDVDYIAMNQGEGYGRLRLMEDGERPSPFDIAIYEALPNDLPRVAGTITTVPQTPLSHVNLRAIQNGLPNAFIRGALQEDAITSLLDSYVYFAVTSDGYTIRAATKADVDKHFESLRPKSTQTLQSDLTKKTIASLNNVSFADWTAFGVKAANVAELTKLPLPDGTTPVGYAVPFYFYVEFMKQATLGEETILGKKKAPDEEKITLPADTTLAEAVTAMLAHSYFKTDADIQEEMLDDLRKAIKKAASPAWIITALNNLHAQYPDGQSLRYRSSTNNEDLPSFNGAGLYSSKTQKPDETTEEGIDKSIKQVWASLWNYRAFLERDFHRIDHNTVAMGVLVHPNYSDETVNGVAVSYDPITFQDGIYYVNSQKGEDLVTNPEANSQPEQVLLGAAGATTILSYSNLVTSNKLLMSADQMVQLRSNLETIHNHFKTLYGPEDGEDFAIEIEFKITAANKLAIKQARPWIFSEPLELAKPEVTLALSPVQAVESGSLQLTATRSGGIQSNPLTVDLSWSETRAMLTGSNPASVTIPGNQASATITVPLDDDEEDEHESVVTASIAANSSYAIGTPGSASATVTDNDLPSIGVSGAAGSVTEGSPVVFNFTRSGSVLEQSLSANITVADSGSRLQGDPPTTVNFPANSATASVSLPTADDQVWAALSDVTVQIDTDSAYGIEGSGNSKVTVNDDDPRPPTLLFGLNHQVRDGGFYHLNTYADHVRGDLTTTIGGPDKRHFIDYANIANFILLTRKRYDHPVDANRDGVYEIDLTASASRGGTTTVRLRFTVVNAELISVAQQHWDQLSLNQRVALLPETGGNLLEPAFANLAEDVEASVLRLARQGLLPSPGPTISIAGGGDITEGGSATFTITANPAPATALPVGVTVSQTGDYGATTGSQTVTIPTGGTYTLTIATTGDEVHEDDGAVKATVDQGNGYVVSWANRSATVVVSDDDDPPDADPEITISGGSGVSEGETASFTISASPAPASPITVNVGVTQQGDFGATGVSTVSVSGETATYTVSTSDDEVDEADGSVTATVQSGDGYTVGAASSASVNVADDDDPPPATPEITISGGSGVREGGTASFTINADPAPASAITVNVGVTESGAWGATGASTVTVSGATTSYTITTSDDEVDEADGSVTAAVQSGSGYTVGSASSASVNVADDDDPPPATPEITITGGSGITEGGTASFTITASPAPASAITVNVGVTESGAWGATGASTVTVSGATTSYTITTSDDEVDEADGSVTAAVQSGSGYTVGSASSASVNVADDDDPPVVVNPPPLVKYADLIADIYDTYIVDHDTASAHPKWKRVLKAFGHADYVSYHLNAMTSQEAQQLYDDNSWARWAPIGDALAYTESYVPTTDPVQPPPATDPEITISGGSAVTEGWTASFTITASPEPANPISVNVGVSQSGRWGATGASTVTVSSATTTYTITTSDDQIDEADGSVTATIQSGSGYTVGSASSATVNVADDDDPPVATPEITITAGSGIAEGGTASFTITASPVPASPVTVNVGVSQSGDWGATGASTVTVSSATTIYTIATSDDQADEADGSVTATVRSGVGYSVGASSSASVAVSDDDPPPTENSDTLTVAAAVHTTTDSGGNASPSVGRPGRPLLFTVTASDTAQQDVTVSFKLYAYGLMPSLDYCLAPPGRDSVGFNCATLPYSSSHPTGTATIKKGQSQTTIAVVIDRNAWITGYPRVRLTLTSVTGAKSITTTTATGNVRR